MPSLCLWICSRFTGLNSVTRQSISIFCHCRFCLLVIQSVKRAVVVLCNTLFPLSDQFQLIYVCLNHKLLLVFCIQYLIARGTSRKCSECYLPSWVFSAPNSGASVFVTKKICITKVIDKVLKFGESRFLTQHFVFILFYTPTLYSQFQRRTWYKF